jgi:hypothetical protein
VTKLQTALGFSPEQVAALPPPLVKIRELEQENARLQRENDELRRALGDSGRGHSSLELGRRETIPTYHDARACDRDFKRRKMNGNVEEVYMASIVVFKRLAICLMLHSLESQRHAAAC